ncbi:hypothetical protein ACFOOM_12545 [Streptomyces echinoruber]|uniref:Uncharacterized protein n=1 Tax=Streptomyces echinoruber TaxID=68898 RepID=A0A918VJH8_9ACTN|nr:hypothetical protein [Streptomyces echinoruber]GHA00915.1 hypothetical protein GCM10010389_45250 [Streptomyces echinoruber]
MTIIILAGALGVVGIVVFLLFRQLRELSWQLTQLRVERDSERILRDIGLGGLEPAPITDPADQPEPVRKKRHLALYLGGFSAPLLGLRDLARRHRRTLVAGGAVTAAAAAAVSMALILSGDLTPPSGRQGPVPRYTSPAPTHTAGPTPRPSPSSTGPPGGQPPGPGGGSGDGGGQQVMTVTDTGQPLGALAPPRSPEPSGSTPPGRRPPDQGGSRTAMTPVPSAPPPRPSASASSTAPPATAPAPPCLHMRTVAELRLCLRLAV